MALLNIFEGWHALTLFLTTFLLEDAAIVLGIGFIEGADLSFAKAFGAIFAGIVLGDLGLYLCGTLARKMHTVKWARLETFRQQLRDSKRADLLIIVSRMLPGSRLPIYLAAGYFGYPLGRFTLLTALSVFAWVALALSVGRSIAEIWSGQLWAGIIFGALAIYLVRALLLRLIDPWRRKSGWHAWRRWTHFEFWPAWLFYLPVVFWVAYLTLKYRSLRYPLYANPGLRNGGLIGESKWDYLKYLRSDSPWTLGATLLTKESDWRESLHRSGLTYPVIFKPDVGQRGYGVRRITSETEAEAYLSQTKRIVVAQQYCDWKVEVGIFYHRLPDQAEGKILSITRKEFPFVVGDGDAKLGDLILKDVRARIVAGTYFARFGDELDRVPSVGEKVPLALSGNHCQGAIFWDGRDLITPELTGAIDRLAKEVPNFYFGRIDVRAPTLEALRSGREMAVIEINGSGSEMTHIWDRNTPLTAAYSTLFRQWDLLFKTGERVMQLNLHSDKKRLRDLAADLTQLFNKEKTLTIAS